jgi:hypothetical protein
MLTGESVDFATNKIVDDIKNNIKTNKFDDLIKPLLLLTSHECGVKLNKKSLILKTFEIAHKINDIVVSNCNIQIDFKENNEDNDDDALYNEDNNNNNFENKKNENNNFNDECFFDPYGNVPCEFFKKMRKNFVEKLKKQILILKNYTVNLTKFRFH